jgi:hypothetical protein
MQRSFVGVLFGTLLVIAVLAGRGSSEPSAAAQGPVTPSAPAALIAHVTATDGGPQAVTVIDPGQRVMAVYHVDKTTGEIALKSVRNLTWDLQLMEFNSGKPLPQDIREMRGELQR